MVFSGRDGVGGGFFFFNLLPPPPTHLFMDGMMKAQEDIYVEQVSLEGSVNLRN
jgi:hypothetical protein